MGFDQLVFQLNKIAKFGMSCMSSQDDCPDHLVDNTRWPEGDRLHIYVELNHYIYIYICNVVNYLGN